MIVWGVRPFGAVLTVEAVLRRRLVRGDRVVRRPEVQRSSVRLIGKPPSGRV
jgi:hypothetical protein